MLQSPTSPKFFPVQSWKAGSQLCISLHRTSEAQHQRARADRQKVKADHKVFLGFFSDHSKPPKEGPGARQACSCTTSHSLLCASILGSSNLLTMGKGLDALRLLTVTNQPVVLVALRLACELGTATAVGPDLPHSPLSSCH